MGIHNATVASTAKLTTVVVTTAETLIVTTPQINLGVDNAMVMLFWYIVFLTATGTTFTQLNLRRGAALTSPQINASVGVNALTAPVNQLMSGTYVDTPGVVAGQQYSISIQASTPSANGTVVDVCLVAMVL